MPSTVKNRRSERDRRGYDVCALSQDKPYALFGTCLGAITCYEVARRAVAAGHPPLALFTAAVSPPHVYAAAVAKLYVTRPMQPGEDPNLDEVMEKLRGWDKLPKETLMMVCFLKNIAFSCYLSRK